ncbi:hypothetical protein [Nannocystis sp.]|uniref:hypothetical protein n=1 Tax=Nannocystis sp. TaxID=1962667 RepID=UPI0025E723F9|nr:hypothetical protein [Nannocystis sp.]MBK7829408.1 hypothetical protein [Nannocystis sp.]
MFFEVGGAGCVAERFMLSAESLAFIELDAADDPPPGQPQAGHFCGVGPLPGLDLSPAGEFTAQICGV